MLYRRNRYFDPVSGQFTQQDPIGTSGGMNLWGFANGDPVNYSDPFGLCPVPQACLFAAAVGGAALGAAAYQVYANVHEGRDVSEGVAHAALQAARNSGAALLAGEGVGLLVGRLAGRIGTATRLSAARRSLPGSDLQFGRKFGAHLDRDIPGYRSYAEYRQLANDIYNDPASIRSTTISGEIRYRRGHDLLRLDPQGNFRSLYRDRP
jgi:uncharacterized protein RhaS with RHS repeats